MVRPIALFLAGIFLAASFCQSALALDELFPEDKKDDKPFFSDFTVDAPSTVPKEAQKDPEAAKKAYKEMVARGDEQMRNEIQHAASWLQEFSLRNQNRFPGVYGDSNTIQRASEVQLTELVGANPYASAVGEIQERELSGLAPGLSYFYNPDGTPVSGSPLANDEWTAELTADNAHRVQLQMDQSATPGELDSFRNDPPSSMQAAPGTIVGAGNGQGFLYVWGAGIDGKPVKDASGKRPYIVSVNTADNVEDVGQEAGY